MGSTYFWRSPASSPNCLPPPTRLLPSPLVPLVALHPPSPPAPPVSLICYRAQFPLLHWRVGCNHTPDLKQQEETFVALGLRLNTRSAPKNRLSLKIDSMLGDNLL